MLKHGLSIHQTTNGIEQPWRAEKTASDEQCLEMAGSARMVLGELSERLSQALKDEAELTKALSTLMNKKPKS